MFLIFMAIMVPICWGYYIYVKKIGSPIIDWLQKKERWWGIEDLDQNQYDNLSFLNQLGHTGKALIGLAIYLSFIFFSVMIFVVPVGILFLNLRPFLGL